MVVLQLITGQATYGYELIQKLDRLGGGFFKLKDGTLYPLLYRLEDSGLICSSWQQGEGKNMPKKYYAITPAGKEAYQQYRAIWRRFTAAVAHMCEEEQ